MTATAPIEGAARDHQRSESGGRWGSVLPKRTVWKTLRRDARKAVQ